MAIPTDMSHRLLLEAEHTLKLKYDVECPPDVSVHCQSILRTPTHDTELCMRDLGRDWRMRMDGWINERPEVKSRIISGLVYPETLKHYGREKIMMTPMYTRIPERSLVVWREQQLQAYRLWVRGSADIVSISYHWVGNNEDPERVAMEPQKLLDLIAREENRRHGKFFCFWLDVISTRCSDMFWKADCLLPFYIFETALLWEQTSRVWPTLELRMKTLGEDARKKNEIWPDDNLVDALLDDERHVHDRRGLCKVGRGSGCQLMYITVGKTRENVREDLESIFNNDMEAVRRCGGNETRSEDQDRRMMDRAGRWWNEWACDGATLYSRSVLAHSLVRLVRSTWLVSPDGTKALMMDCCSMGARPTALLYDLSSVRRCEDNIAGRFAFAVGGRSKVDVPVELLVHIAKGIECWYHYVEKYGPEIGPHIRTITLPNSHEMRDPFRELADTTRQTWIHDTSNVSVVPGCRAVVSRSGC